MKSRNCLVIFFYKVSYLTELINDLGDKSMNFIHSFICFRFVILFSDKTEKHTMSIMVKIIVVGSINYMH